MRPVAVILDFDGVVVDSLALHLRAWATAVQTVFRGTLVEPASLAGHATRTIAHILCRRYGDATVVPHLIATKEAALIASLSEMQALPGAQAFIAGLVACGMPHGLASNSPRAFVHAALAALGLRLPVVLTGDDVSRPKPAPDIFFACANQLGVAPGERERVVVYEDSAHGIKAARAAGMLAIGVCTEQTPAKLLSSGALSTCQDLGEALARGWLDALPIPS